MPGFVFANEFANIKSNETEMQGDIFIDGIHRPHKNINVCKTHIYITNPM